MVSPGTPEALGSYHLTMALGFGFNKAKVLASAEKYVQQGKLQNAISEYEKITKEDPKDQTVLNTIGDLYAREGQNDRAAHYFKKVGDQYAQNGFTVKAIAIYKKLAKLQPHELETTTKLAELYAQQGLLNDARAQYMHVADHALRSGDNNQAARIFQRILELDPENANMQAKLADLYVKIGKKDDARKIYQTAAEGLYARGLLDAAGEALDKALSLDPENKEAVLLRGMIAAGSGDHSSAIRHLEQAAESDAKPETMHALLEAKLNTADVNGADEIATKLWSANQDISGIRTLAEWYSNNDHLTSAVKLYEQYAEQLFPQGTTAARDTLYPLVSRLQDNPQALKTVTRLLGGSGETAQSAEMMETQAHACAQKGDFVRARDLYKTLMELEPENSLHGQNYKQMLAKLGEDSATRILSPEEAAQAFMVEELVDNAPAVQQKYDPPTESAIEAALTDAELFVSYNVPSKAIPPLEAALPLAPKDVNLNQRLASLYARAERWADAARMCQNLSEIYRELGHPNEAAKYQEAGRKYQLRAPQTAQARQPEPLVASEPEPAVISPHLEPAGEPSIKEFSFDITEPATPIEDAEPAAATAAPLIEMEVASAAPEIAVTPVSSEPREVDLSNEWESMLTVEPSAEAPVPAEHDTQPIIPEPALPEPEPVAVVAEPEGGSGVCYLPTEKIQEVQFYISQEMWPAAKKALLELTEIAPDAPEINELMAAVAAGQRKTGKSAETAPAESFAAAAIEPASSAVDFLPPPFAAPVPHTSVPIVPEPAPMRAQPTAAAAAHQEQVLDLPIEVSHAPATTHVAPAHVAKVETTEDVLGDFLADLEKGDLADFAPKPKAEPPAAHAKAAAAPAPVPVAASAAAASFAPTPAPAHQAVAATNGSAKEALRDAESSSVLNDIFSDLQEETAATPEAEEDPETHYNLGIAFKEMGLLDEAIGELQKVCRAVDQGKKFSQPIQAYTWLAQCLVDKGAPEASLRWYNKALQLPGLDDSSRNAIYYDLAAACEASGDKKSALANFMEVYGSNIDFRDVASRIKALKS